MIERLSGKIVQVENKSIVLDVGGVGYQVFVANNCNFVLNQAAMVFISTIFSQDKGLVLYGFDSTLKRQLFTSLIGCHKIGPQTALGILANVNTLAMCKKFVDCIVMGRDDLLTQHFKISPKTALAVVSELKDKLLKISFPELTGQDLGVAGPDYSEVVQALRAMGYKDMEIMPAISAVYGQGNEAEKMDFAVALKRVLAVVSK